MTRIKQLAPEVVNQIAAGEVIERPASVVKEMLENAVDAGSSRIDVEVEQGGTELIRVVDNGCGILPDDLPLALASHATSKLHSAADLFHVATLGFRGEALASIASIARVTIQSRPTDQSSGAEISSHGGQMSPARVWNGAPGTRIEVQHLFYNTPVRRKFLRTTATEMGHVCEAFTRLALAHPGLHLTLRHNGKHVYEVPGSTDLRDRIGLFFGKEVRDQLYAVEVHQGPVVLHGYIADPACERGTAKMQYLFLNGRCIRDRSLGHALQEAYRGLLMTGRYAVVFLCLDVPPDQVDVNVHPTKAEVRFREAQALYHLVFTTIRDRLRRENLTARLRPVEQGTEDRGQRTEDRGQGTDDFGMGFQPTPAVSFHTNPIPPATAPLGPTPVPTQPPASFAALPPEAGAGMRLPPPAPGMRPALPDAPGKAIQLYDAYIVLETPEGMLVIDQHALHERILFEQLKERIRSGPLEAQRLLIPEPVDLPADQSARVLEHREALAELGLGVEDFGGGTLLLTSYPAILGNRSPQSILLKVVDHLMAKERVPNREQFLNNLLSLMACHAAVRSGDRLTPEEINALIAQRDLAQDTHHCPHGRPTSLLFSKQELDRQFRRI
jgi:DNA mismatch repair protein MutL